MGFHKASAALVRIHEIQPELFSSLIRASFVAAATNAVDVNRSALSSDVVPAEDIQEACFVALIICRGIVRTKVRCYT